MLVWPCLYHLQKKHCTINQMIIFNDLISKFYQCSIWDFSRGLSMFFSISASTKKKKKKSAEINFLAILKKYISKNKIYFCLRKKGNVFLNKKVMIIFYTIFKLDFITQIIHRCLCFHFILFCSLISVSKRWNIETMLTFHYSYKWQKFGLSQQPQN